MSRFEYALYEISGMACGGEEHLCQDRIDSAYEAIKRCLDKSKRLDYFIMSFAHNDQEVIEFSPYAKWGTWEEFEKLLNIHILSTKTQLNIDTSNEQAALNLLISHIDLVRNSK